MLVAAAENCRVWPIASDTDTDAGGGRRCRLLHYQETDDDPCGSRVTRLIAVIVLLPSIIAVAIFIYGFIVWTFYISTVKWDSTIVGLHASSG